MGRSGIPQGKLLHEVEGTSQRREGVFPRKVSIGERKEFLNGEKGCSLGRAPLGVEETSWWGEGCSLGRVSLWRGRNFSVGKRGTPQGGALSRTKGTS